MDLTVQNIHQIQLEISNKLIRYELDMNKLTIVQSKLTNYIRVELLNSTSNLSFHRFKECIISHITL
jgi:hypothetical protein